MKHLKLPVRVEGGAGFVKLVDANNNDLLVKINHERELVEELASVINQHERQVFLLKRAERYFEALGFDIAKEIRALLSAEGDQSIIGQVLKERWDDDGSDPGLRQKDLCGGCSECEGMDDEVELEIDVTPEELREEEEDFLRNNEDDNPNSTFYD